MHQIADIKWLQVKRFKLESYPLKHFQSDKNLTGSKCLLYFNTCFTTTESSNWKTKIKCDLQKQTDIQKLELAQIFSTKNVLFSLSSVI